VNPTWMVETVAKHHGCMVNNHDNPPWIHIYIYILDPRLNQCLSKRYLILG
jgi:hypothetical protein